MVVVGVKPTFGDRYAKDGISVISMIVMGKNAKSVREISDFAKIQQIFYTNL